MLKALNLHECHTTGFYLALKDACPMQFSGSIDLVKIIFLVKSLDYVNQYIRGIRDTVLLKHGETVRQKRLEATNQKSPQSQSASCPFHQQQGKYLGMTYRFDGDVPRSTSYGVYISQLIRFARVSCHVDDFNIRNKIMAAKLLKQGYRYHKLRVAFSKFYRQHFDIVSKYNVGLKTNLLQCLSEPEFYGDLLYR